MSALSEKILRSRESVVPAGGFKFTIRRPTDLDMIEFSKTRRPADLVARYGGEEFACILPETDFSGAMSIARLLEDRVRKKFIPHAGSEVDGVVTISLGVAVRNGSAASEATELLAAADEQLYHAKHTGRGRACGRLLAAPPAQP